MGPWLTFVHKLNISIFKTVAKRPAHRWWWHCRQWQRTIHDCRSSFRQTSQRQDACRCASGKSKAGHCISLTTRDLGKAVSQFTPNQIYYLHDLLLPKSSMKMDSVTLFYIYIYLIKMCRQLPLKYSRDS